MYIRIVGFFLFKGKRGYVMAEFEVSWKKIMEEGDSFQRMSERLGSYCEIIRKLKRELPNELGEKDNSIEPVLDQIEEQLEEEKKGCLELYEKLQSIAEEYKNAELIAKQKQHRKELSDQSKVSEGKETEQGIIDWSKGWDNIKELAKALGLTAFETAAFLRDLGKLIGAAGMEGMKQSDTDWKAWFMKYVPENVSDYTMLGLLSFLSILGISEKKAKKHKNANEEEWAVNQNEYKKGDYIEYQDKMSTMQYGNCPARTNACEVIAAYNALQSLTGGNGTEDFPDLLYHFERDGITAYGELGTSPQAIHSYFTENGYATKMIAGKQISSECVQEISDQYTTYIMTAYNDQSNLESQIHTVSITRERTVGGDKYVMHNDYAGAKTYDSLEDAVFEYNTGNGEPISLIGIK